MADVLLFSVMRLAPRTRRYVSRSTLLVCRPLLSYDGSREAWLLRGVGRRMGPVLREDRRRGTEGRRAAYSGPERRGLGPRAVPHADGWVLPR